MKPKFLSLLAALMLISGLWQTASSQCATSFTLTQQSALTIAFTNTSTGNYSGISWYFGDGTSSSVNNPVHTYSPGIYGVCLSIWDSLSGCQSFFCDTLVITNTGGCQAYFSTNYINNATVSFNNMSAGVNLTYLWDFGDGTTSTQSNPVHTYQQGGSYNVCLTIADSSGCSNTYCGGVFVQTGSGCNATFIINQQQGNTYAFVNTSTGNFSQTYWNFGDGTTSTAFNPTHTFSPGVYMICLSIWDSLNGCQSTYCDSLYVGGTGNCNATFTSVDSAGMTWFFPQVYQSNLYYSWNFGDGTSSTQAFPVHQYNTPGTFLVCLAVIDSANNCIDTYCDSVTNISPNSCNAGFSYQQNNGTAFFSGSNTGGGNVASWFWSFGDGTSGTGSAPVHTYSAPGTYTVCLTIVTTSNCVDSVCNVITITSTSNCNAGFNYQSSNNTANFFGMATGGGSITSWAWYFGDGTTASGQNPVHTFPGSGYWTVCLYITTSNGCSDSTCQQVYISGPISACQPYFTYTPGANNTVTFSDQSVGNPTNYYWNFGDGGTSTAINPVHQYAQNGVYYVCLTIIDSAFGCTATYCDTVIIGNIIGNCNAQFQYFDSLGTYYFMSNGSPNYNYYWTFGDGFISYAANPTHIYSNPGAYSVCLTIYDSLSNCSDTWCDSIFVGGGSSCQAYFSFAVDTSTYATAFTNLSQGNFTNVIWSFGDGTSSAAMNPSHTYTTAGTYLVCLTIFGNSGCQSSYCDSVVIGSGSNCIPQFYAVPDSVFGNGNVTFFVSNQCPGWTYVWSFGDSTSGTGSGPFIHQYNATGWYIVCVTAYDSLGNAITWCDSVYAFRTGSTGIFDTNPAIQSSVFPNPSAGPLTIRFSLEKAAPLHIEILNIHGQIIYQSEQDYPSGLSEIRLDLSDRDAGMYMLRLRTAEHQTNSRFFVQP